MNILLLLTTATLCAMALCAPEFKAAPNQQLYESEEQSYLQDVKIQQPPPLDSEEAASLQASSYTYKVKSNTGQVISIRGVLINPSFVCLEYYGTLPLGGCSHQHGGCDTWWATGVKLCYDDYRYIKKPCIGSFGGKGVQAQRSPCR